MVAEDVPLSHHHDLSPAGLAHAACSAAAAAVEVTVAQVHTLAKAEKLVLVKALNETGFEGVRFRPAACALLCKPFKARYEAGEGIEHLGYFSSPVEGALAYARRLGPAASKAAAATVAAAARRAAPPPAKKQKMSKDKAAPHNVDGSSCVGKSSDASRASARACSGDGDSTARGPAAEKGASLAPQSAESIADALQAKLQAQLTVERLALMAAIVHTRTLAGGGAAGAAPPTAKELHAAVGEPRWNLPPPTLAAVKKTMSLLVAMQRAGMPLPGAAGEPHS